MLRGTNEKKNLIYWNSELYFMIVFLVLTCVKTDVIRDITGEFQYVSTMNFKVVGETVDGASFQFALRQKIQEIYIQTMNDDSIWIEIIKPHDLRSHERRKRASTRDISAEYIIHTTEKKNETELHAIAELYKKQKCSKETNNCQVEDIGGVSMVFNSVLVLNDSAICNITRNHCDEKTSTCSSDEGKLECRCNKGYVKKNTNSLQCFGEFQYVSTMNFKVVGETVDGASFQFALRQKIQEIYIQTMNDDSIWIEIIKLHDLRSHERRKRASTRDISAEYIIHTTEKKNETELHAIAELYKKQKCSKETNNCQVEDIGGVSMVFNSVLVLNDSAICNITRNHCDEKTSTCSSDEGKLECRCNKGYVKKNTNSLQCFDKDECANYQACPLGTACSNTVGSWDCWCPKGLKAIETSPGKKECQDPCIHARCLIKPTCRHFDNEDGYICRCQKGRKGKYCQEIDYDHRESNFKTTMYIICGTLGGIAVICIFIIIGVCRKRLPQIQNSSSRTSSGGQTIPNNASNVLDIPTSNQPQRQKAGRSKGAPQRGNTNKRKAEKGRGLQSNSYRYGQRADSTDYNISHLTRDEHQYETIRDDHVYDTIQTYVNM